MALSSITSNAAHGQARTDWHRRETSSPVSAPCVTFFPRFLTAYFVLLVHFQVPKDEASPPQDEDLSLGTSDLGHLQLVSVLHAALW